MFEDLSTSFAQLRFIHDAFSKPYWDIIAEKKSRISWLVKTFDIFDMHIDIEHMHIEHIDMCAHITFDMYPHPA